MNLELNRPMREMLELLADGKRYEDMAQLSGLSVDAMKSRGKRLMDALDAETLAHAVAIGFRYGLLQLYPASNLNQHNAGEAGLRREDGCICKACIQGRHSECPSEECPCVCNDSGFQFQRESATREVEMSA
jgi:hypothetical protein